jgi:hypothetical protein
MDLLHRFGPWVVLSLGVLNVFAALFFKRVQQLGDRITGSDFIQGQLDKVECRGLFERLSTWSLHSLSSRIVGLVWGIALMAAAAAWLWWRP